jgi:hypothetical protein
MSSRNQRISNGIDSLVRRLLVEIPGEDAASAEEREQNAIEFVREVLGRYVASNLNYLGIFSRLILINNLKFEKSRCCCRCKSSL